MSDPRTTVESQVIEVPPSASRFWFGVIAVALTVAVLGIWIGYATAGGVGISDGNCNSGTWASVRWDRYQDSDGSIDERPNPKAGYDTVRLFICHDGTVRGRIDRTAPRR